MQLIREVNMIPYIDSFVFPIAAENIESYASISEKVAEIWKEHGALSYQEFISDDASLEGVRHFEEAVKVEEGEVVVIGWVSFPSKEIRDIANEKVATDTRMATVLAPLFENEDRPVFEASRMIFGGFKPLIG